MEQNTRPAPDNDLEAYGDWVTVDSAAPPAAAVRQPPAATADVDTAAELTGAEEEFLGRLSDADHAAAGAFARDAGHPAHNGNGNGEAETGIGHPGAHAGGPAAGDTPATPFADEPTRSPGPARSPGSAGRPALADQPPPSDRVALAAGAAASAAYPGAAGGAGRAGIAASAVPAPPPAVVPAPLPAVPAPAPVRPRAVVNADHAAAPANAAADPPAPPKEQAPEAGGGQLADLDRRVAALERRVAALAADSGAIAARAGLLQAGGDPGEVQVSIEELDGEPADEAAGPGAQAADAAPAAAASDSQLAPMIRLVPIDEEDEHAAHLPAEGEAEASAGAAATAGEPPPEAAPAPPDDSFRNDVREVLRYLDQLLDDLPPERVREFAQSAHFATYKALFTELGLDE